MPEEPPKEPQAITWVRQRALALWTTLGSGVLATVVTLLRQSLSSDQLIATLLTVLATATVLIWTFAAAASRQRAKISKLETRIRDLESENSSYRNPPPISDADQLIETDEKILMSLTGKKQLPTVSVSKAIGIGIDAAEVRLAELKSKNLIHFQMMIDRPGYWYLSLAGKRYLIDRNLIQ